MNQHRIPKTSDFPKIKVIISETEDGKKYSNVMILFHGLGDTEQPFAVLGSLLNLPETICLSVRGPMPLPFDPNGFHWGDDLIFDQSTGGLDMDAGFEEARKMLNSIIDEVLVKNCGWSHRAIFFLGFGQGGMIALDAASRLSSSGPESEYGGVISMGGPLPSTSIALRQKKKTPVLVLCAEKNSAFTETAGNHARDVFQSIAIVRWVGRNGDGMMRNASETKPIMEFLSRRLKSYHGIPEGAIEVR